MNKASKLGKVLSVTVVCALLSLTVAVIAAPAPAAPDYQAAGLGAWTRTLDNGMVDILAHPTDGDLFFAASGGSLYRSDDGGATWSGPLLSGLYGGIYVSCLSISPARPDLLMMGGSDASNGNAVYTYTIATGAVNVVANGLAKYVFDIAACDSPTAVFTSYLLVASGTPGSDWEVLKSTGLGHAYIAINSGLPAEPRQFTQINVSRSNSSDVLLGTWSQGIYKLDTNSDTWHISSNGFYQFISGNYAAAQYIEYEPCYGNVVLVGTNGAGIYRSDDRGQNWYLSDSGIQYDTPGATGFAFDPGGSGLVWSSVWPMGVYCSPDLGSNWYDVSPAGLYASVGQLKVFKIAASCDLTELIVGEYLPSSVFPYNDYAAVYQLELTDYYFAEGYTGEGFDEYLCLANFSANPSNMAVIYVYPDRPMLTKLYRVGPNARYTVNVNNEAGTDGDVSVRVVSDMQAVAERPIYFDYGGWCPGGHDVIGAREPLTEWYFAEGYTGTGFNEYLCMANFGTADAVATVEYIYPDQPPLQKDYLVQAGRRLTVNVNTESETAGDVSIYVNATRPVVAERPMYFDYAGKWRGGHDVMGAGQPGDRFYFAEGYTGTGFEEYLCLMNPNNMGSAAVNVNYYWGSGGFLQFYYNVGAKKRVTVNINEEAARVGHGGEEISLEVISDAPIVAERPMYFDFGNWCPGGHDVMGADRLATEFYFAEGYTGEGFQEYLCILVNTGSATVDITYIYPDKPPLTKNYTLPGLSRTTLNVNQESQTAGDVSVKVESNFPILVERPMYFNYGGKWTGGHDVIGATF